MESGDAVQPVIKLLKGILDAGRDERAATALLWDGKVQLRRHVAYGINAVEKALKGHGENAEIGLLRLRERASSRDRIGLCSVGRKNKNKTGNRKKYEKDF